MTKHFKKLCLLSSVLLSTQSKSNDLTIAQRFQKIIETDELENNKSHAKSEISSLLGDISIEHPLYQEIFKKYLQLNEGEIAKKIKFEIDKATGEKEEVFCQDIGIVAIKTKNLIGESFEGDFEKGTRKTLDHSFVFLESGKWKFDIKNLVTHANTSGILRIVSPDKSSFEIHEIQQNEKIDFTSKYSWQKYREDVPKIKTYSEQKKDQDIDISAIHLISWGSQDLAYLFDTKSNQKQDFFISQQIDTPYGLITLNSSRIITAQLPTYKNKFGQYTNCLQIKTKINLAKFEPNKSMRSGIYFYDSRSGKFFKDKFMDDQFFNNLESINDLAADEKLKQHIESALKNMNLRVIDAKKYLDSKDTKGLDKEIRKMLESIKLNQPIDKESLKKLIDKAKDDAATTLQNQKEKKSSSEEKLK